MLDKLNQAFNNLKNECEKGIFNPILEDDFVARIYHHLLTDNKELLNKLFVKTRILKDIEVLPSNNKYDLVIGERVSTNGTVYVKPCLVAEFKIFPEGFSPQQRSKRRDHVIEDINKLNAVNKAFNKPCVYVICLFDAVGWLLGYNQNDEKRRLQRFIEYRDKVNTSIKIIGVIAVDSNNMVFMV
ncbi:hypothetical protein JCM14036_30510 [Desulfotomaculum defluvii]